MIKKVLYILFIAMIGAMGYIYFALYPQFPIANGYAAKKMCSCTFISGRSQESIQKQDLGFGPLSMTKSTIDRVVKSATTTMFGFAPRTAVYRGDVGCILLDGKDDYNINLSIERPIVSDTMLWPFGSSIDYPHMSAAIDFPRLAIAVDAAFDKNNQHDSLMTRAVVVIHKGQLIAEKYIDGFDANTELLGWSMAKSITSTMIGILVKQDKLSLSDKHLFTEWQDDRKDISLKDLLQMQSGLDFTEDYANISDATKMLFMSDDVTSVPVTQGLSYPPGNHWSYSSGTTNLLSGIVSDKLGSKEAYLRFPYTQIFNVLGMNSTVLETDESGHYIGSSFCYATPRDWAKFGLLYLNQGNWNGTQIIDTSWVDFVKTPASDSDGKYGGQFWLNDDHSAYPDVPADLYSCNGFQGQYVFIIPSYDLVVVRMGLSPDLDVNKFLRAILASIEGNGVD